MIYMVRILGLETYGSTVPGSFEWFFVAVTHLISPHTLRVGNERKT